MTPGLGALSSETLRKSITLFKNNKNLQSSTNFQTNVSGLSGTQSVLIPGTVSQKSLKIIQKIKLPAKVSLGNARASCKSVMNQSKDQQMIHPTPV